VASEPAPWIASLVLLVLLAGLLLHLWWKKARRRWKIHQRIRHAQAGEQQAEQLLIEHGYDIEAVQPRTQYLLECDGERFDVELRADMLVNRGGERFVVDVKTGEQAPRITTAATRRQLLEYGVAYRVDGILLVDIDRERIQRIRFIM
jgi:membrane protein implicated in regulation of membrane protease activity